MDTSAAISRRALAAIAFVIVVAGAAAYINAAGNGATNFDDAWQVTSNPLVTGGMTLSKLSTIIFHSYHGEYQPVKLLSYAADYSVYPAVGVAPVFGIHLTNIVLHIINAVLVAALSMLLVSDIGAESLRGGKVFIGLFSGVYFVLHPIHVESVAWLSSRKDVLSFLFMALSFLAFRRALFEKGRSAVTLCLAFFALAVMSKATVVCLPLVATAYWVIMGWRGGLRAFGLLAGLYALAGAYALLSMHILAAAGYVAGPIDGSYWIHMLTVIKTFPFYMRKMLFPVGLSAVYSSVAATGLLDPAVLLGAALAALQVAVVIFVRARMVRFIVLWYLLSLLPVLGILPMPVPSLAADRYAYVGSFAFALAPAVILWQVRRGLLERGGVFAATILVAAGVVYGGVMGLGTWSRNRVWESSETLWRDVLNKDKGNRFALLNLGQAYFEADRQEEARELFSGAAKADPGFLMAYTNLALSHEKAGDVEEARLFYGMAIERPSSLTARATIDTRARAAYGLARLYFNEKKYLTSRRFAEEALRMDASIEGLAGFHAKVDGAIKETRALADELIATGDAMVEISPDKAAELYEKAAAVAPEYSEAPVKLARLYYRAGEFARAFEEYKRAAVLGKSGAEFDYEFGVAALRREDFDTAAERLSMALAVEPSMDKAKVKLALAKAYRGEPAQALVLLEDVLAGDPGNEEAKLNHDAIKAYLEERIGQGENAGE